MPMPQPPTPLPFPLVPVGGLPFVATDVAALSAHIATQAAQAQGGWVVTPNIDILRRWQREAAFRQLVAGATVFTADGAPIVWASRLAGTPLPGRLAGSDLFVSLFREAQARGLRMLLLGGNPGAAEAAARQLGATPGAGGRVQCLCPPMGFEHQAAEMAQLEAALEQARPDIVFVGLGSPKQEALIHHLRPLAPQAWYLGVGVSFSFVAGDVRRAPAWAQASGLEWAYRLLQEPGRLARRYLVDGLPFAFGLLAKALLQRWAGPRIHTHTGSGHGPV